MAQETVTPSEPLKKKKSPAGKIILIAVLLIIVVAAVLFFRVPQKVGLVKSPAERLFAVTPDNEKADAIMADLEQAGLSGRGVEVYVLPVAGTDDDIAMIVLDASKGFDINQFDSGDPVKELMKAMSGAGRDGINRAAVAYLDETGKQLVTATLPTDVIADYETGKLTDRQLMEKVDVGTSDIKALISKIQEELN
jgi:hypothetical protein